jgi:hypothetical protein
LYLCRSVRCTRSKHAVLLHFLKLFFHLRVH